MADDVLSDESWLLRTEAENATLRRAWRDAGPLEWGGWMLRQDDPIFSREDVDRAPHESGIYSLWDAESRLLYVGKASSLLSRLTNHWHNSRAGRAGWWAQFCYRRVPVFAMADVEIAHIYALTPPQNRLYEPRDWPGHNAMLAAIRQEWIE